MALQIKRVVTAVGADGTSTFQEDAPLEPVTAELMPGTAFHLLWGTEGAIRQPARLGTEPVLAPFFPGPGGTRFGLITYPPRDASPPERPDREELRRRMEDFERRLPGMLSALEPDAPGFHATQTIDYDIVLQGTMTLELDDGAEVELPAGSCIVQNGTRHHWHNYGDEDAILAFVLISAEAA